MNPASLPYLDSPLDLPRFFPSLSTAHSSHFLSNHTQVSNNNPNTICATEVWSRLDYATPSIILGSCQYKLSFRGGACSPPHVPRKGGSNVVVLGNHIKSTLKTRHCRSQIIHSSLHILTSVPNSLRNSDSNHVERPNESCTLRGRLQSVRQECTIAKTRTS